MGQKIEAEYLNNVVFTRRYVWLRTLDLALILYTRGVELLVRKLQCRTSVVTFQLFEDEPAVFTTQSSYFPDSV